MQMAAKTNLGKPRPREEDCQISERRKDHDSSNAPEGRDVFLNTIEPSKGSRIQGNLGKVEKFTEREPRLQRVLSQRSNRISHLAGGPDLPPLAAPAVLAGHTTSEGRVPGGRYCF